MSRVRYEFVATGQQDVVAAFKSTTAAAKESAAAAARAGSARSAGASASARAEEVAAARAARAVERSEKQKLREKERAQKELEKIQKKDLAEIRKALDREEKEFIKQLNKDIKEHDKAQKKKTADAQREAKKRAAAEEQVAKANKRVFDERVREMSRVGSAFTGVNLMQGGVGMATNAIAAVTGKVRSMVVDAARESVDLGERATRIAINAQGAGEELADPAKLKRDIEKTAMNTPGISSDQIAAALEKFVGLTGDLKTARAQMPAMATAASAFGAAPEDIAATAAALSEKFDVKGLKELQQSLAVLGFQGKQGAFELKDMAMQVQRMSASAAAFNIGKGSQAVAVMGGLAQIARRGTGNARQATTAVENVFGRLSMQRESLEAQGVRFHNADGTKRNIQSILTDTIARVGGDDLGKKDSGLRKVFGMQGFRAISPLFAAYSDAFRGAGPNASNADRQAAGARALDDAFRKAINTAGKWSDVVDNAATAQSTASAKLTGAWEQIKAALGPAIDKSLPALVDAIPPVVAGFTLVAQGLSKLADFLGIKPGVDHGKEAADLSGRVSSANEALAAAKANGAPPEEIARLEANKNQLTARKELATAQDSWAQKKMGGEVLSEDKFVEEFKRRGNGGFLGKMFANDAYNESTDKGLFAGNGIRSFLLNTFANDSQKQLMAQMSIQKDTGAQAPKVETAHKGVSEMAGLVSKVAAAQAQLDKFATATDKAAEALGALKQPGLSDNNRPTVGGL